MMRIGKPKTDKPFHFAWCALHLVNAAGVVIILMNVGSARHHWKHATRRDE